MRRRHRTADPPSFTAIGEEIWLSYDEHGGASTTGRLETNGTATTLVTLRFESGRTHVVATGGGVVMFHGALTGQIITGRFDADGGFTELAVHPDPEHAHAVVAVRPGMVMCCRSRTDGRRRVEAVIARVLPDGRFERISGPHVWDFWTHYAPAGDGLVLCYSSFSGVAATALVTPDGGFGELQRFTFEPCSDLVGTGDGTLLAYDRDSGTATTGRVDVDGTFTASSSWTLGPVQRLVPTTSGRIVVGDATTSTAFRIGADGRPAEAQPISALPVDRPLVFVR